ncbi:MAG TPA: DUF1176 domain-containing protein [Stenotrophomonas sp.]|nr:DUF1176 domain-containing protein [Stenotrophomonas sp.]
MRLLLTAPLLMGLALPGYAAAPVEGVTFTHHDWTLACDNTRTCRAAGYQADDNGGDPVSILLTRAGGPDQPVQAELMLGQYDDNTATQRLSLQINGTSLGPMQFDAADGTATFSAKQLAALLASLTRNSRIELIGDDGARWTVSDQGASAVLLKMDAFQGRLGTPGALMRKGTLAESSVPPALPVPVVQLGKPVATRPADTALAASPALRAALAAVTSADDCEALGPSGSVSPGEEPEALTVQRLSADKLLVSLSCWRGAYNTGDGYWVINDRAPYQPRLVTTAAVGDEVRTIQEAHKGRGLGDCWYSTTWGWTGTQFVKTEESSTGLCRLVAAGGAWEMPTLVTKVQE